MEKRKINWSLIITIIIFLAVAILVIIILSKRIDYVNEVDAKFIGNNSVLYVQYGCSHCDKQEAIFGDNIKYLKIVDCFDKEHTQECISLGIEATPTWVINGTKYTGFKTLSELKMIFIKNGINN